MLFGRVELDFGWELMLFEELSLVGRVELDFDWELMLFDGELMFFVGGLMLFDWEELDVF